MIRAWGTENDVRVLNVAGPRASEVDGMYDQARAILDALLSALNRADGPRENPE
jgi:hypothetical protein